jgi:hypothetical protein
MNLVYQDNIVKCHSCGESMEPSKSWLLYMGLVFHNTGSCLALYEKMRGAKRA